MNRYKEGLESHIVKCNYSCGFNGVAEVFYPFISP